MTHELRKLLEEELAGETPPPLGDVVRESVDSGRRVRRRRRLFAGAGGGTAAAVLAFAGLLALGTPPAPSGKAAEAPSPTSVIVAAPPQPSDPAPSTGARCLLPSPSPSASTAATADPAPDPTACPEEVRVLDLSVPAVREKDGSATDKTTPASALALLAELLPKGRTDGYAYSPDGYAHVQMYLDQGDGFGMIRVYVGSVERPAVCSAEQTCAEIDGVGLLVLERNPTDCTRFQSVTLQRRDGVEVTLQIADCLMWDGRQNPAGAVALDLQEAVTVVLNPAWGPMMPISLIKSGEFSFSTLDPIVGG